jgi:hypothetical protein
VFDTVAAVMAIWSNNFHVDPESVEMKRFTSAAAEVAEHCAAISRTRVPAATPEISEVIVPDPSMAVFAVDTDATVRRGVETNAGAVAIQTPRRRKHLDRAVNPGRLDPLAQWRQLRRLRPPGL